VNLLESLAAEVGGANVLTGDDAQPYLIDWRQRYRGRAQAVVRPGSTAEVAAVVGVCVAARAPMVPQGGNTGLVGGGTPDGSGDAVVVSLQRMNRVRSIDTANDTVTVEAGCVLQAVQQAALEHARLFPLSLAAEGSATIGGNLATNAGGTQVLRYGNARDLTLGLEVVLASGEVWNGLRGLRKDNTGYDLKHLFIGAEGTLGIVTAAVLKLHPRPRAVATALAAVPDPAASVALLGRLRAACGERVTGFELISRVCLDLVFSHLPATRDPFPQPHGWYVLVELSDSAPGPAVGGLLEEALAEAAEAGIVRDAVVAASEAQRAALWALRENISDAQKMEGVSVKHDVSVPVSRVPQLVDEADRALQAAFPGIRTVAFGHVGDGNLHYNAFPPPGETRGLPDWSPAVNRVVYDAVRRLGGSISAEHGIGALKLDELPRYKDALELELMRAIKRTLDPRGVMNPGKVIRP
jgi:FAD/FMN-containing dehydrogenase